MPSKLLLLTLLEILIVSIATVRATDLRGQVDGTTGRGVGVALFSVSTNGTFAIVRQTATGPDGVYYLNGVFPGQYILQIAGINYPLGVGAGPKQDIPVIALAGH